MIPEFYLKPLSQLKELYFDFDTPYILRAINQHAQVYNECGVHGIDFAIDIDSLNQRRQGSISIDKLSAVDKLAVSLNRYHMSGAQQFFGPDKQDKPFVVAAVGCHGVNYPDTEYKFKHNFDNDIKCKRRIQELISTGVQKRDYSLVVSLGDNCYSDGLPDFKASANLATQMQRSEVKSFILEQLAYNDQQAYSRLRFSKSSTPSGSEQRFAAVPAAHHLQCAGNHDYGIGGLFSHLLKSFPSFNRLASQIEASYYSKQYYPEGHFIPYPYLHMPYRFYIAVKKFPTGGALIFYVLDSNFLYWDDLQDYYFQMTYKELNKSISGPVINIVVQHHPLITVGKRGGNFLKEVPNYLKILGERYSKARGFDFNNNMAKLQYDYHQDAIARRAPFFEQLGKTDNLVIWSAHDHYMAYFTNIFGPDSNVHQFVSGGGGGSLQDIVQEHYQEQKIQRQCEVFPENGYFEFEFKPITFASQTSMIEMGVNLVKLDSTRTPLILKPEASLPDSPEKIVYG